MGISAMKLLGRRVIHQRGGIFVVVAAQRDRPIVGGDAGNPLPPMPANDIVSPLGELPSESSIICGVLVGSWAKQPPRLGVEINALQVVLSVFSVTAWIVNTPTAANAGQTGPHDRFRIIAQAEEYSQSLVS